MAVLAAVSRMQGDDSPCGTPTGHQLPQPPPLRLSEERVGLLMLDDHQGAVEASPGAALLLSIERGGEPLEVMVIPAEHTVHDPVSGEPRQVGRIGIGPRIEPVQIRFGFLQAWGEGARRTWESAGQVLSALKVLVSGSVTTRSIGGPIAIAQAFDPEPSMPALFLPWIAFLSVNMALLNLLPIPPLAGAGLCFLLIEALAGKPLPSRLRRRLDQAGGLLIAGLIVLGALAGLL